MNDTDAQDILDGMSQNITSLLRMVAPDCSRMILMCRWHGEFRNCSQMFTSSKTDDGFCCSFNTVSLAEGFATEELDDDSDSNDYEYDYDYGYSYGFDDYQYESIDGQANFDDW